MSHDGSGSESENADEMHAHMCAHHHGRIDEASDEEEEDEEEEEEVYNYLYLDYYFFIAYFTSLYFIKPDVPLRLALSNFVDYQ